MTEDEAKTKWCPFARVVAASHTSRSTARNRVVETAEDGDVEGVLIAGLAGAQCVGSACMAWRTIASKAAQEYPDDYDVGDLPIAHRSERALALLGVTTVGGVRRTPDLAFMRTPDCGRSTVNELRRLTGPFSPVEQQPLDGFCGLAGTPA